MTDAGAAPTALFFYSPWQLEPEELRATFVGRQAQFERLKREVADQRGAATLQHILLVGPRGIGKSHLMALLYHAAREEETLRTAYVPVALAEEEYGLGNLRDLTQGILERLQTALADEGDETTEPGRQLVEQALAGLAGEADDTAAAERGLAALTDLSARLNRQILLFAENLDMVLGEQFSDDWGVRRLRDFLMNETALLWLASAPTVFAEVDDAERPLFKLFRVERVEDLSREDLLKMLLERARHDAPLNPAAKRLAEGTRRGRARLQAVLHLTGGSPRLALMLYQVALRGNVHEAQQALNGLLDQLSPYFQERMRGLSAQRRKIVRTLADSDGVLTPTQIARRSRVGEPKLVVAQLRKLLDFGWVTRPYQSRSKETYYTLREVLFRYWHQWRTSPSRRARMSVFVQFLTLFYGAEELEEALASGQQALPEAQAQGEARSIAAAGTTVAYLEAAKEKVVEPTAEEERAKTAQNLCWLLLKEGDTVAAVGAASDVWRIAWEADDPRALSRASGRLAWLGQNVARREAEAGNLGNASEQVTHLARLRAAVEDSEPVNESLLDLFRWALRHGHAGTVSAWLEIVNRHPRLGEEDLFHPVGLAARIATTGDRKQLDSLAPEMRQVVEELLSLASEEPS